jgi:CubicO group peptidase (beta-lactamase class C family)
VNWRSAAVTGLADAVRSGLPDTAVAAAAADEGGYAVKLSDACPLDGRFEIGSVTKTMTGAVLASLVDEGTVGLDDEIARWLVAGGNSGITLVQLATHTSGLHAPVSCGHRLAAGPACLPAARLGARPARLPRA